MNEHSAENDARRERALRRDPTGIVADEAYVAGYQDGVNDARRERALRAASVPPESGDEDFDALATRQLLAAMDRVWPNDSEGHDVKFHVGTGTVVCTCGAYFESERFSVTLPRSAVSLWAEHVRRTRPIPPAEKGQADA